MSRGPETERDEAANDAVYHPADANGMTWEEAREYILPPAPTAEVVPFRPRPLNTDN
jgi:hypothetical protein